MVKCLANFSFEIMKTRMKWNYFSTMEKDLLTLSKKTNNFILIPKGRDPNKQFLKSKMSKTHMKAQHEKLLLTMTKATVEACCTPLETQADDTQAFVFTCYEESYCEGFISRDMVQSNYPITLLKKKQSPEPFSC